MTSERDKMLAGQPYDPGDAELQEQAAAAQAWMARYNAALALGAEDRRRLLAEQLGAVGRGVAIRPPLYIDYGFNIRLGDGVFLNFGCVILDVTEVTIALQHPERFDLPYEPVSTFVPPAPMDWAR